MLKQGRRMLAALLGGALAVTSLPIGALPVKAGVEDDEHVLAHFTFDDEATGWTGGKAKAVNHGADTQNGIVHFTGSEYIEVLDQEDGSLLTGKDNITISYLAKTEATAVASGWTFFAASSAAAQTYQAEHYLAVIDQPGSVTVERYNGGARATSTVTNGSYGEWKNVVVTVEEDMTTVYVDGEKKAEQSSPFKLSEILGNSSIAQFGKANWGSGEFYKGYLDEFMIYDKVLTQDEITAEKARTDSIKRTNEFATVRGELKKKILGSNSSFDAVKSDLSFPDKIGDIDVSYEVTGEAVDNTGKVVYNGEENAEVSIKVTGKSGTDVAFVETIEVTVLGSGAVLQEAVDAIEIDDADAVKGNVALYKKGLNGTTIDWTSSNKSIITDEGEGLYDGGIVTRPESDTKVKLTASVSKEGFTPKTKEIEVTVKAAPKNLDTDYSAGYLWANFAAADGYEKIFYGYSEDGLNWKHLNKNKNGKAQPILTNDAEGSDLGVRDPHLIRSAEGDKYWIIGTDLHAEGGGAGGSGWNTDSASKNLVVWESDDLVNWSDTQLTFAGLDTAGCVWAPEAIYDEANGDYMVYWAAKDEKDHGTNNHPLRVYLTRTRDFKNFSEPQVWLDESVITGNGINIIDTTILYDAENDTYYRYSTSDWNTVVDKATDLNGEWERIISRGKSTAAGLGDSNGIEGLTAYQLPDGRFCVMGDHSGYKAYVTDDLANAKYTSVKSTFDSTFRHGTVVRLSATEEEKVLAAFPNLNESGGETPTSNHPKADANGLFYSQDFEGAEDSYLAKKGNAKVTAEGDNHVLSLDGSNGAYAELPEGWFDGMNTATISFDVKTNMASGNFFTLAIGQDNQQYMFLRTRASEFYTALTTGSYQAESSATASLGASAEGKWKNVALVFDENKLNVYVDGVLEASNESLGTKLGDLGADVKTYLGRSFYSGDAYFNGAYDNIKIYEKALTQDEIVEANDLKLPMIASLTGKKIVAIKTDIDEEAGTITWYVSRNNSKADLKEAAVSVKLNKGFELVSPLEQSYDLSDDFSFAVKTADGEKKFTVKTVLCNNPALPDRFADPDVDAFNGKYYIYPTTDGFAGWSGYQFHVFSSEDLVDWTDEGVIVDLKANTDEEAGVNEKGVQIAAVPWSDGSAWAPTIEEKDGKYYFYFCANDKKANSKAIGVAWADQPEGPFTVADEPLVTMAKCQAAGISMGQTIDPSIFTEDDGTSYMLFGNGKAAIVELNDDMISLREGTMKNLSGATDFREAITVTKREGKYHFTWSCDDTGSENYSINYGVSNDLYGPISFREKILAKDKSMDILGTGHHSILHVPDTDDYYIVYHRFWTPLGQPLNGGLGNNRETCIDKLEFDEDGYMKKVTPTLEGIMEYQTYGATKEADEKAVKEVQDAIAKIGTVTASDASKTAIEKAKAAYEALSEREKSEVPVSVVAKLEAAQNLYEKLKAAENKPQPQPQPAPSAPAAKPDVKGTVIASGTNSFVVTDASAASPEVAYKQTTDKKAKKVTVPATIIKNGITYKVTGIADNAFKKNKKVTSVTIPAGVKKIGKNAFAGCTSLKKVTIPAGVTEIGANAFKGCKKLKNINIKATALKKVGKNAFKGIHAKATIKVPKSQKKNYTKLLKKKGQAATVKIK